MRKKPYTFREFYTEVKKRMQQANAWPDELFDYELVNNEDSKILSYTFDVHADFGYANVEGVFISLRFCGTIDENDRGETQFACAKSLCTDRETMQQLAIFGADFVCFAMEFVGKNLDDFTWLGYQVEAFDSAGKNCGGYHCLNIEQAEKRYEQMTADERYENVTLTAMDSRKILKDSSTQKFMSPKQCAKAWDTVVRIYRETVSQNNPQITMDAILQELSYEKTLEIFAVIAAIKKHDERIYGANRKFMDSVKFDSKCIEWDRTNPVLQTPLDDIHTSHINNLITELWRIKDK